MTEAQPDPADLAAGKGRRIELPRMSPALKPNQLQVAAHARAHLIAIVSNETTYEEVMTPAYWQNHVPVLGQKPFALVEVIREDGSMDLTLRCLSVKPGMALMRCLRKFVVEGKGKKADAAGLDAADTSIELPPGYKHAHVPNGAERGHMIRLPNGEVLVRGGTTKKAVAERAWAHYNEANKPAG